MAAHFTISDSESEEVDGVEKEIRPAPGCEKHGATEQTQKKHKLKLELRETGSGRIRLSSESHVSEDSRAEEELGTPTEGFPFRGRSKSAPPALWAAKKYGQQLRRMSDEFDSLLDRGEMKKTRPIHHSKTWWSYLFSHQESEGESNHHESHRTE
ncbi:BCL2 associated agonist of cell death b [Boleophthalmus pectinirostris]|uniref:BCL2 associated agonist of cell death b n=1 Tax=Boleophthalmus pectinirostris TaxID=150288 RepID=UPI000A1C2F84|nr:BCL2 associated agonist of cell death b [Boleophthalmus pectinirostris]XP_055012358.1 BCL2 associated agonist of cell death b [Boleophthalmus pectinirostris]